MTNAGALDSPKLPERKIQFIGDSDTAAFCVQGTPDMNVVKAGAQGWELESCASGYASEVSARLDAQMEMLAISGIGVYQNNLAIKPWALGENTLPDFYNRTLQS